MDKFRQPLKKALATFIFSTGGLFIGVNVFDVNFEFWKLIASTGIGSLINLSYRWAEATLKQA